MSNTIPLPPIYQNHAGKWIDVDDCTAHAAAVSAAKDARIKVLEDALRGAERELQSCQSAIHLCGGFDPAYVLDAQAALKVARAALGFKWQ